MKKSRLFTALSNLAFIIGLAVFFVSLAAVIINFNNPAKCTDKGETENTECHVDICDLMLSDNSIQLLSFVISGASFVFAALTYHNIDLLNKITSMEGNVLDNEKYVVAYEEMMDSFKKVKDKKSFTRELLKSVECPRKTESCIEFADYLQNILDHLVFFGYVDFNKYVEIECDGLIKIIKEEAGRYKEISNGIKYQLNENIKLIEYVLKYQKIRNANRNSHFSKLENIRGSMLKNPVSQILYYNYLGLDYKNKVIHEINKIGINETEFTEKWMQCVWKNKTELKRTPEIVCLIDRADKCLQKAHEKALDNILWDGYILYNKVRIDIIKYLLGIKIETDSNEWIRLEEKRKISKRLNEVIEKRRDIMFLFNRNNSYLDTEFEEEFKRAKNLKDQFDIFIKNNKYL